MSITRLQQARQMYAQGQRVGRAFGGVMGPDGRKAYVGGSHSDLGGYQGEGDGKGGKAGGEGTGTDGQGGTGGDGGSFNAGPEQIVGPVTTPADVKEQYAVGTPVKLGVPITPPDFTKVGPGSTQYGNYIDKLNLQGETYKPPNLPFFVPGSTLIKTLGSFGFNKNKDFFNTNNIGAKINPKTNKPFGFGIDGFKAYMEQRTLGNVGAYGGTELSQNAINASSGGDNGIMDVYNAPNYTDDGDADGDGDVDQDDFIFRYFDKTGETLQAGAGGVQDLMTRIRQRISDIFS